MKRRRNPAATITTATRNRRDERGAALIMMLLISMLLLAAGGALIMTTSLTTTTIYDATPEAQAYYAAETGLDDTLNVLRGNRAPSGSEGAREQLRGVPIPARVELVLAG